MKNFIIAATLVALTAPMAAFAHGDKLDMTVDATAEALKTFKADHADQVVGYQGIKFWFENDIMKVRIYLPNSATMLYSCAHSDEGGNEVIKCQMQM